MHAAGEAYHWHVSRMRHHEPPSNKRHSGTHTYPYRDVTYPYSAGVYSVWPCSAGVYSVWPCSAITFKGGQRCRVCHQLALWGVHDEAVPEHSLVRGAQGGLTHCGLPQTLKLISLCILCACSEIRVPSTCILLLTHDPSHPTGLPQASVYVRGGACEAGHRP